MADKDPKHQQSEGDSNQGKAERKCETCEYKVEKAGDMRNHVKKKHTEKQQEHQQDEGDSNQGKAGKL